MFLISLLNSIHFSSSGIHWNFNSKMQMYHISLKYLFQELELFFGL